MTQFRLSLDPPPCRTRGGDILRAQDRPKRPTGPLTAPRGAWGGMITGWPAVTPTGSLGVRNDAKRLRRLAPGLCTLEVEGAHVRQVLEHWGGKAKQLTDLGLGLVQLPKVQRVVLMADLRPPVGEEE